MTARYPGANSGSLPLSVDDYGAKGDGLTVTDAAITVGTKALTSASGPWTAADVGKPISVTAAALDVNGTPVPLFTAIAAYVSATQVTLTAAAAATATGATAFWVTDSTTAIGVAFTEAWVESLSSKVTVVFPGEVYGVSGTTILPARVNMYGWGGQFDESDTDPTPRRTVIQLIGNSNCDMFVNDQTARTRAGNVTHPHVWYWQQSRVEGISFHGNRGNQSDSTIALWRLTNCWSVHFENVALLNSAGYGLYTDGCNEVTSSRLTISSAGKSPAYFKNCADCQHALASWGGGFESALVLDGTTVSEFSGFFFNANPKNTTLSSDIDNVVTTIPASSGGFPTIQGGTLLIGSEQITYTGRTPTSFTGCVRGANSTVAASHLTGARVQQVVAHADGVHIINSAWGNRINGRADMNYGSSVYIDSTSHDNETDLLYLLWGYGNATGQPAIDCQGDRNRFDGVAPNGVAPSNTTIGLNLGDTTVDNESTVLLDPAITTSVVYGSTGDRSQKNMVHKVGNQYSATYSDRGTLHSGPVYVDGVTSAKAIVQFRPATGDPGALSRRPRFYADNLGPAAGPHRLMARWPTGTPTILALETTGDEPGILAPMGNWPNGTFVAAASRRYMMRFVPKQDITVTKLRFAVSGAATNNDSCDVGILDSTGTPIVSSGATAGKLNATGVKEIAVAPTALKAGTVYLACFAYGTVGGTAATLTSFFFGSSFGGGLLEATAGTVDANCPNVVTDAAYPIASTQTNPTAGALSASAVAMSLLP